VIFMVYLWCFLFQDRSEMSNFICDRLHQLESRLENFSQSVSQQYNSLRQQLLSSIQQLDKSYSDTLHSLNSLSQHFRSEVLIIQHELQFERDVAAESGDGSGEVGGTFTSAVAASAVSTSVVTTSAVTMSAGGESERSYANIVRSDMSARPQMSQSSMSCDRLNVRHGESSGTSSTGAGVRRSGSSRSPERSVKRPKFQQRPGQVGFISDSMLKFLVEDECVQSYLIQSNYEKNVLFHRGASAREVFEKSKDKIHEWSVSGVDKVIACLGTNDIVNMQYDKTDVKEVVGKISSVVTELKEFCSQRHVNLVYVMPGVIGSVSLPIMTEVYAGIHACLEESGVMYVDTPRLMMSSYLGSMSFEDSVRQGTTDSIHWVFRVVQQILKSALEKFGIGCILENVQGSCYFLMLKKYAANRCYRCGKTSHGRKDCNYNRRVRCEWCGSETHVQSVCGFKFMPCTHCGEVGHYMGHNTQCPYWRRRQCERGTDDDGNMS